MIIPCHHIWAFVLPIKKSVVSLIIIFLKVISFWVFFFLKILSVSHCNRSICRTSFYLSCLGFTGVPQTLDWPLLWLVGNDRSSSLQILPLHYFLFSCSETLIRHVLDLLIPASISLYHSSVAYLNLSVLPYGKVFRTTFCFTDFHQLCLKQSFCFSFLKFYFFHICLDIIISYSLIIFSFTHFFL